MFAVGSAVGLVVLASHAATVADYTVPLMILVGLGVGIDYALLLFSRYRGELLRGADRQQAARTALDTAGRTVLFAGCTVIIALLGLIALGLGSLQGVAIAVAVTVLVTMLGALTLLPALLAIMGRRIERAVLRRAGRRTPRRRSPLGAVVGAGAAQAVADAAGRQAPFCSRWPPPPSACAWASRTRATTRGPRPAARPTTCSPRASGRASAAR